MWWQIPLLRICKEPGLVIGIQEISGSNSGPQVVLRMWLGLQLFRIY
jgi:hypothetical protein